MSEHKKVVSGLLADLAVTRSLLAREHTTACTWWPDKERIAELTKDKRLIIRALAEEMRGGVDEQ